MSDEIQHPHGFVIYETTLQILTTCTPLEAGNAIVAGAKYFFYGEIPDLDRPSEIAFLAIKGDIEQALRKYDRTCERNREIAKNRNKPKSEETDRNEQTPF